MVRVAPREKKFFDMFADMCSNIVEAAKLLEGTLKEPRDVEARVQALHDFEHKGDEMTRSLFTKLNSTFITPFDREDIYRLASSLDDVLDHVHAAGERLVLYKIGRPPQAAAELAKIIVQQGQALAKSVAMLEKNGDIMAQCGEITRLESAADKVARDAIARLFDQEKDPINLIKLKELYEVLEAATDRAEDAANVLETVMVKSA
jgi:predicted phosphate transport protein (TIGR00153 family)